MTETVRRGRPRSEATHSAIIEATIDELIERGFIALTMEGVAARAGVAKTTVYRRWPNTTELAVEAMRSFDSGIERPPDGPVRDQLVCLIDAMRRKWMNPRYSAIMRRVTGDAVAEPEMYRAARDRLITPHVRIVNDVLARGVAEGLIRPDVDVAWVRQLLASPILAAALTLKNRVTRAEVEATVDAVLRGVAP